MTRPGATWWNLPTVGRYRLVEDLRRLGLPSGADILVHSSLSRIGKVVGGADTVIAALGEVVGMSGTVLFPTLTGTALDGPSKPPAIDVRTTPCWTGRIPDTARQVPGALRSLHPTHSVAAIGAAAATYAAGHEESATPSDERSPYYRLVERGGWILLLGATQESNTTLHCLEELARVPYHLQDELTDGVVVDALGETRIVRNRLHLWRWKRDFPKVDGVLRSAGLIQRGQIGCAEARLVRAKDLVDRILPFLQADPLFLLDADARDSFRRLGE
jgi:aminoglycoside 3-N-acetyltransferase